VLPSLDAAFSYSSKDCSCNATRFSIQDSIIDGLERGKGSIELVFVVVDFDPSLFISNCDAVLKVLF
jgi:hypothetical protein